MPLWHWHILSILSTAGRGISADTCGLNDVFPLHDIWSEIPCLYIYIYVLYIYACCYRTYSCTNGFHRRTLHTFYIKFKLFFIGINCDPLLFDDNEYRVTKMRYLSLANILFLIPGRGIRNLRWNAIFLHIHMCHSNISDQLTIFQPYVHMSFNLHLRKVYIETHAIHLHTFYYDMFTLLMTAQTTKF